MGRRDTLRLLKIAICVFALCMITYIWMLGASIAGSVCIENTIQYLYTGNPTTYCDLKGQSSYTHRSSNHTTKTMPFIYVVTPSGVRLAQKADLTRLSYTFMHVPRLHWILVEDRAKKSSMVADILKRSGLPHTHLNVPTPTELRISPNVSRNKITRGLTQRNIGIQWIHKHARLPAVVFFADDDNTYDLRLFDEMRYTKQASVWPTGFSTRQRYQSPIVTDGTVTGWLSAFGPRRFCTDMSGFAINLKLFFDHRNAKFKNKVGHMETDFLSQFKLNLTNLEPKADNCTKILVWHTRTEVPLLDNEKVLKEKFGHGTDLGIEV